MSIQDRISKSEFHKWRAIFALCHVDGVVCDHEQKAMNDIIDAINFSSTQEMILRQDMKYSHDAIQLFQHITDSYDRQIFFRFARLIAWSDGIFHENEESILDYLQNLNMTEEKILCAIENLSLEFEKGNDPFVDDFKIEKDKPKALSNYDKRHSLLEIFVQRYGFRKHI